MKINEAADQNFALQNLGSEQGKPHTQRDLAHLQLEME